MKKNMRNKFMFFNSFLLLFVILQCSKPNVKNTKPLVENIPQKESKDKNIEEKYLKEGFLSNELFRVVIVSTRYECEENIDHIKNMSKRRAFLSLQKYLSLTKCNINSDSNRKLLRFIKSNGSFLKQKINGDECEKNNVFYYDIKKNNIKAFLVNISYR